MKYLLIIPVLLFSVMSIGQSKKFTFKLGSEYQLPRKSEDLSFFGNNTDGIVNLSLKKEQLSILRFDPKTLNQTTDKEVESPERSKYFNSETVVDFGNNYFWVHSDYDKSEGTEILYYDKIDVVSGKITEANHKMFSTTKMANEGGWFNFSFASARYSTTTTDKNPSEKYYFNFDAGKTKMLVSYRLFPEYRNDKKNYDKIGMQVFDNNMKLLWGQEYTMPYTEAIMDNIDFSVDADGNAYLLAKVYDSDRRKERDKETGLPAYHYEVLKFTKDSKKYTNTAVSVGSAFIREASLVETSQHDMLVACSYSKKAKGNGTSGVFLSTIDKEGKVSNYKQGAYEFPLEEIEKYESARTKRRMERKDDYEIPHLKVVDVLVDADGGAFITLEQSYVEVTRTNDQFGGFGSGMGTMGGMSSMSPMHSHITYDFYYEDIYAAKINKSGAFEWMRKIPKRQQGGRGVGTMSFKFINDETGYYFLFLDNKKNLDLEEGQVPKYHRDGLGGQVMVVKLDKAGNLTKEIVFDTREEEVMIFPSKFTRINGNQFIGRAKHKRTYQPLLITVN